MGTVAFERIERVLGAVAQQDVDRRWADCFTYELR